MRRIAVVGAGMGSLATAIRLAAKGFEVEVFEKNDRPGGRMGRLDAGGFTFDTGPSLLLMTDTYRELLKGAADKDFRLRQREKLQYTASAFMLYLGIDRKLDHMLHHNFYLSGRYKENFEAIFRERTLPEDPSFYAVVPSKTEPRLPPEGMESLFVLVPHLGTNGAWERDGAAFREKVYGLCSGGAAYGGTGSSLRRSGRRSTGGASTTWRRGRRSGTGSCRSGTSGRRWSRRPSRGFTSLGRARDQV